MICELNLLSLVEKSLLRIGLFTVNHQTFIANIIDHVGDHLTNARRYRTKGTEIDRLSNKLTLSASSVIMIF
jgi:hypothetical protein